MPGHELAEVVVNGKRLTFYYNYPSWMDGGRGSGGLPGADAEIGHEDETLEQCVPIGGLSDDQKLKVLLEFALAVWAEEIKTNFATNSEWGSIFYIDQNGEVKWTSPATTPGTPNASFDWNSSDLPQLGGMTDYSRIIAIAHSHPRYNLGGSGPNTDYYDPADPFRLLRPSLPHVNYAGTNQGGDWVSFDHVVNQANWQRIHAGGAGPRSDLSLVIVGDTVTTSGTETRINRYGASDHGYGSLAYPPGGAQDGLSGARGNVPHMALPPCKD